jgi:hypothetical protein
MRRDAGWSGRGKPGATSLAGPGGGMRGERLGAAPPHEWPGAWEGRLQICDCCRDTQRLPGRTPRSQRARATPSCRFGAHEPRSTRRRRSRTEPSRTKALRAARWRHAGRLRRPAMQDSLRRATRRARPAPLPRRRSCTPWQRATQVKHTLGSASHAARAFKLPAGDDPRVSAGHIATSRSLAHPVVVDVLRRYPDAPSRGGRVGELIGQPGVSLR